jgi:hypothetical protein
MNKIKYIAAVLIAIAGLGLQQAHAITYTLSAGNDALTNAGFSGPYGTATVTLGAGGTTATVVFTALTQTIGGTTYQYMFGDGSSVAVNTNGSASVSGISGTCVGCVGFSPGGWTAAGSGNVDGFGVLNQTINSDDGFTSSSTVITFTLTKTSGTWSSDANVLIANVQGALVGAHIFVTLFPANTSNGAIVTGFAANGGSVVPDGGTTVMLLGAALGALGMARRFLRS